MKLLSKEELKQKLLRDKNVLIKALIALNDRQTADEQNSLTTKYLNNAGFRPCHAARGTGMVRFFTKRGFLSEKQVKWWTSTEDNKPRILVYLNQLHRIHSRRYQQFLKENQNEKAMV
jgi:hypothetical protein